LPLPAIKKSYITTKTVFLQATTHVTIKLVQTCLWRWGWAISSGMKSRQICIDGIPATVRGNSSQG